MAQSAPYNPNPGNAPVNFVDSTGTVYNEGFFQLLRRNTEGGPRQSDLRHTTYRGVIGSKGDIGSGWSYDAYYQYGRNDYSQVYLNDVSIVRLTRALNAVTDNRPGSATQGQVVCRSVIDGSDPSCVPFNVFAGAGGASQAAVSYLSVPGFQSGFTSESVINGSVSGNLGQYGVKSPWASEGVAVNVGIEWRKETLNLRTDNEFSTGDLAGQGGATLPLAGSFNTREFFAEAQVPIVHDGFVYDLSFNTGVRRSRYSTSADNQYRTTTYKFGLDVSPIKDVRFRGTYNRAVRAPNIQELFATSNVSLDGSTDPCAGFTITATDYGCIAQGLAAGRGTAANPAGQYNGLQGGNPDLQPERATTYSFGTVLQPSIIPNFALTVDYFNIKIDNAIRSFGADAILQDFVANATATFTPESCSLVHRDTAGSLWLTPGGFVTDLPGNVGSVKTRGIEFDATYRHDVWNFGSVSASFTGTQLLAYDVNNGLTEPYDCAGFYGPTCSGGGTTDAGAPLSKWRHKARLTYNTNVNLSFSAQWRFVGPVSAETLNPSSTLAAANRFDPGLRISGQSYFDLVASYVWKDKYSLRFGVNNVLDKQPPFVTSGNGNRPGSNLCPTGPCNGNTYPATYDALGRYLYVNATLNF